MKLGEYIISFFILGFPILCLIWFPIHGIFTLIQKVMPKFFDQVSLEKTATYSLTIAFIVSNIMLCAFLEPSSSDTSNGDNVDSQIYFSKYTTTEPTPSISAIPSIDYNYDFDLSVPESYLSENPSNSYSDNSHIVFVTYPTSVFPGSYTTVKIKGKPYTTYSITVHYSSGSSKAAGLEPKQSSAEGYAIWSWKVGTNTYAGSYPITVSGGGSEKIIYFEVLP